MPTDDALLAEQLQALAVAQVTVTAAIDAAGRLSPVGGLWPKLLAAAQEAATVGLLRAIVVSAEQPDIPSELEHENAAPLRLLRAATLSEAIQTLYEEHGPRHAVRRHEQTHCATLDLLGRPVSLADHYQTLPLLREVSRDRLFRVGRSQEPEDDIYALQSTDILRWEEELSGEHVTYEQVELDQLFAQFQSFAKNPKQTTPRFVVLGPPGSGKTTLTQYLSWRAAHDHLHAAGRRLLPARVRLSAWEKFAVATLGVDQQLFSYLTQQYSLLSPAPTAQQWRRWLQDGEVLLLFDGLDEIQGGSAFLTLLTTTLTTFASCPTVLTCRTVSFEQHRRICPDFLLFTLAGLDHTQRDAYIRSFPAVHSASYRPEVLSDHLRRSPQLRSLAATPLLLSIICYIADSATASPFPATRGQLYAAAVERLVMFRAQRLATMYPGAAPASHEKLAILQRAALQLFTHDERQLTFSGRTLGQALKDALYEEGYSDAAGPWANALLEDLLHNSGLLRGDAERGFFFFHLTIQEFLTAAALAVHVNDHGWSAPLTVAGKTVRASQLIQKKSWDPRWREVIVLLVGQLADPLSLLTVLTDGKKDDVFCHRLALAAQGLDEVQTTDRRSLFHIVNNVTERAISTWLSREARGCGAVVAHLTYVLPILEHLHGYIEKTPLRDWLRFRLRDPDPDVRAGIIEAFAHIGESLASDTETLAALAASLGDPDVFVRIRAVEALRRMGVTTLHHEDVLVALLQAGEHDREGFVRLSIKRTLEQFAVGMTPVPEAVAAWLTRHPPQQQTTATERHKREKSFADPFSPIEAGAASIAALHNPDPEKRMKAMLQLQQAEATQTSRLEALPALVEIVLHDPDGGVRARAADVLGQTGDLIQQQPHIPMVLVVALRDRDAGVRAHAAVACGQFSLPTEHRQKMLTALYEALKDRNNEVRSAAAEALDQQMARGLRLFRHWWGRTVARTVEELAAV